MMPATQSNQPLVSVIVPAYNAARFIRRTLQTVTGQTYPNLEILVVDDGSTDDTVEIVRTIAEGDSRVQILSQKNAGVAAARNLAIRNSAGEFIAPIDADDLWFPQKIEKQVAEMQGGGEKTGLVYTWWISIDERERVRGSATRWNATGNAFDSLLFINFIGNASVPLFRKTALDEVGLYNPEYRRLDGQGCEDWDISLRIAEKYDIGLAPDYLTAYRSVGDSMSTNSAQMARSFELMLDDIKSRHPIDKHIENWSRSRFYSYVASQCYSARRPLEALDWLRLAAAGDPLSMTSLGLLKLTAKSAVRSALMPITHRLWPTLHEWRDFRRRTGRPDPTLTLAEVFLDPSKRPRSQGWYRWKPYDRILIRRWKHLTGKPPPDPV